jgi:hypothetical protein
VKKIIRTVLLTLLLPFILLVVAIEALRAPFKKDQSSLTLGEVVTCYLQVWRRRSVRS